MGTTPLHLSFGRILVGSVARGRVVPASLSDEGGPPRSGTPPRRFSLSRHLLAAIERLFAGSPSSSPCLRRWWTWPAPSLTRTARWAMVR